MSLVRFSGNNHPQQLQRRGPDPVIDDRATPLDLFAPLQMRFDFTVDAAAAPHNAKLPRFWTAEDDGLLKDWAGERVWCNPPYSNIPVWVAKAHDAVRTGCPHVVMLLPANRTEQAWWQDFVEPYRDLPVPGAPLLRIEFLRGRVRFIRAGRSAIGPNERPPFGVCLAIWTAAR